MMNFLMTSLMNNSLFFLNLANLNNFQIYKLWVNYPLSLKIIIFFAIMFSEYRGVYEKNSKVLVDITCFFSFC